MTGLVAAPGYALYTASKQAAMGFSLATAADLRLAGIDSIEISCVCPDGVWTPMLFDKLEDPDAAVSFSGVMFRPEEVAAEVMGLLENPVPVLALPKWRGTMLRIFNLMPKLSLRFAPRVIANARRRQRRYARRVRAGKV